MPIVAFDMNSSNHESRRFEFRGVNKAEYYEGDFFPLSLCEIDVKNERTLAGDFAIHRLTSRTPLAFRRSWPHIRNDRIKVTLLWFVQRGRMTVCHPGGRHVVEAGHFTITRSTQPFYVELSLDGDELFEAMHIAAPSHLIYAAIREQIEAGRPFPLTEGCFKLAERVLVALFKEGDQLDSEIADQMVRTLLQGLGRTVDNLSGGKPEHASKSDAHMVDVISYVNRNFASAGLTTSVVAQNCGISVRYLYDILKERGLSLATILWTKRLETAHGWLSDLSLRERSINEIAQNAGFKSGAHFSRMFKAHYGMSPRQVRSSSMVV